MSSEEIKTIRAGLIKPNFKYHNRRIEPVVSVNLSKTPFYRQLLEDYLGKSHTSEMYENLFEEVARDVEYRIKQMNLQSIIN